MVHGISIFNNAIVGSLDSGVHSVVPFQGGSLYPHSNSFSPLLIEAEE